jgi:hypothetical protein
MFITDPGSGSRIQGSKKHRILDPEHWLFVPLQLQIMNTIFGLDSQMEAKKLQGYIQYLLYLGMKEKPEKEKKKEDRSFLAFIQVQYSTVVSRKG